MIKHTSHFSKEKKRKKINSKRKKEPYIEIND